jgi:ribonucleoside-diphosphate reductase beta chain
MIFLNLSWLKKMGIRYSQDEKIDLRKYILYTDRDPQSWEFYKRQEATDWTAEHYDFTKEQQEYLDAPDNIKRLMKGIIGFFLVGDGLIAEGIVSLLIKAIKQKNWPKFFYLSMKLKIENTHAETYSKAALTIIPQNEHQEMCEMCENIKSIRDKGHWIKKYVDGSESEALENVADAVGEGVYFVSLFAIIFYMRSLGYFDNFIESNQHISIDETTHRDEACAEAKRLLNRESGFLYSSEIPKAARIIREGVEIEKAHADYLLQYPILGEQADKDAGLTKENLHLYIEKLANEICEMIDIDLIYPTTSINLGWMEGISISQKVQFYERSVNPSYRNFDPETALKKDKVSIGDVLDGKKNLNF